LRYAAVNDSSECIAPVYGGRLRERGWPVPGTLVRDRATKIPVRVISKDRKPVGNLQPNDFAALSMAFHKLSAASSTGACSGLCPGSDRTLQGNTGQHDQQRAAQKLVEQ
jgi:hypothetical protein